MSGFKTIDEYREVYARRTRRIRREALFARLFPPLPVPNMTLKRYLRSSVSVACVGRFAAMTGRADCKAYQVSDQMTCPLCRLTWDVNDPDPPPCRPQEAEKPSPTPKPASGFQLHQHRYRDRRRRHG